MRNSVILVIVSYLLNSCSLGQITPVEVSQKSQTILSTIIINDPLMESYLCMVAPEKKVIIDNKICGKTVLHYFVPNECVNSTSSDALFEAGESFTYFEPMSNMSFLISLPDTVNQSALESYFQSLDSNSCFVKFRTPYESDKRYWQEIILLNRLNPIRLHYVLIFNKDNLQLMHIWRKIYKDNLHYPLMLCDEKEYQLYNDYIFPMRKWEFGELVDY